MELSTVRLYYVSVELRYTRQLADCINKYLLQSSSRSGRRANFSKKSADEIFRRKNSG